MPAPLPFYARTPEARREWDMVKRLCDGFGTHLICSRSACGRQGRCGARDRSNLPFCFWQHRGPIRFVVRLEAARHGLKPGHPRPEAPDAESAPPVQRWRGSSVLGGLAEAGAPIHLLRRTAETGPDEWGWESDPVAIRMVEEAERLGAGRPRQRHAEEPAKRALRSTQDGSARASRRPAEPASSA